MIRVLFIDDEPKLRQAWVRLLEGQRDLELVGMLERADDLSSKIVGLKPDVVVIDLSIPEPIETIARAADEHPEVRVIVYSGRDDAQTQMAAMDAGAWAYVDKLRQPDEVMGIIRRVAAGEVVLPRGIERGPDQP